MKEQFALDLLIVIVFAKVGEDLARRIGQPALIGQLTMGIILGSVVKLLGYHITPFVHGFAHFGIWLLLFIAGLELNLAELLKLGGAALVIAGLGVVVPFLGGWAVATAFGQDSHASLVIATSLVATSVGVTVDILRELELLKSRLGTLIVGAAVIDDVIGIFVLSAVAAGGGGSVMKWTRMSIFVIAFFALSLTLGVRVAKGLQKRISERKKPKVLSTGKVVFVHRKDLFNITEAALVTGLVTMLAFGIIADKIGLSMITGTFLAGLVLGETKMTHELFHRSSIIGYAVFIPMFFLITGMQFEPHAFFSVGGFAIVLIMVAIASKVIGCGLGAKLFKFNPWAVGTAMAPRAEICLIVANLGYSEGIISQEVFSSILVVAIATSFIVPPFIKLFFQRSSMEKAAGTAPEASHRA